MTITKDMAWNDWQPHIPEVNIKLDKKECPFNFTRRWFQLRNQVTFSTFLPDRFPADKPWRIIQIGVFEGMDLVWQFQNVLKHPDSHVLAIDPWAATSKLDQDYMDGVQQRARHNLRKWRNQLEIVQGFSAQVLKSRIQKEKNTYDLAIIDGDHEAPAVYNDAVFCWELVKPGGWLLFDDVRNQRPKKHHVQEGLDLFMGDYKESVKRVWYHRFCDCLEVIK